MLTELNPTSVAMAGTSALLDAFVPGPFRLPGGLDAGAPVVIDAAKAEDED